VSGRETTKVLGVNKRNIKHGIERGLLLESIGDAFLTNYKIPKRSYALKEHDVQIVVD
jgi:hypothetical protein